jgi:hypothetical protein
LSERNFESALAALPTGYGEGVYKGQRYAVTLWKSCDGKRTSLFARALVGGDVVSFNFFRLRSGEDALRPCEMPAEKVIAFVLGYAPDPPGARARLYGFRRRMRRRLVSWRRAQISSRCSDPCRAGTSSRRPRRAPPRSTSCAGTLRRPRPRRYPRPTYADPGSPRLARFCLWMVRPSS